MIIVSYKTGTTPDIGGAVGCATSLIWNTGVMEISAAKESDLLDQRSIRAAARTYIEENHPGAAASLLGGSAASGTATSTSDLDIAVLYPNGHSNYAETTLFRGWLVEASVHTPDSLQFWYQREAEVRRPVLAELCAAGILLTDNGCGEAWQSDAGR